MEKDRRQPLGGISKETYVHHGGNEITYELMKGMKSDICHEIKQIRQNTDEIKAQCLCRLSDCQKTFVTRAQVYIAAGVIGGIFVGSKIIDWKDLSEVILGIFL